jgi:DNA-binding response OmpR family regulator
MSDEDSPYGCIRIRFSPTALNGALLGRATVAASVWVLFVLGLGIGLRMIGSRTGSEAEGTRSLVVDQDSKHVLVGEKAVTLPPKLFGLIARLAETPGRVYSDEEILRAVWPESDYADSKDVKQCVYMLRRRLRRVCKDPERVVVNVKGHGYRLDLSGI